MRKTEVVEHLLDDVDGSAAAETISFAIDGKSYEIDLSKRNAKALRADLEGWAQHARRARGARGGRRGARRRAAATGTASTESATVRAWAVENGVSVPTRGRIPRAVLDQYNAAH